MQPVQTIGFHESSIVAMRREESAITLELEGVHYGEQVCSAVILLKNVRSVTCDGIEVETLHAEAEDGEVLTLQHTNASLHLIIEWTDFNKHQSATRSYRFKCGSVEVDVCR